MRAAKWQTTDDVLSMVRSVGKKATERRLKLFMLACAEREVPPAEIRSLTAAARAVRSSLTGQSAETEIAAAQALAHQETRRWCGRHPLHQWALTAVRLLEVSFHFTHAWHVVLFLRQATSPSEIVADVARHSIPHAGLAREVFGPGRKQRFLVRWRTETVRLLADAVHADQAYDRLPILADALEEAGCDNAEMLAHCRGPGPHVFGCWALDLVRGCY